MSVIHTLCLNTAIDARITVAKFLTGTIMRSTSYREYCAGKGVNNAKAIACLGGKTILNGFCGINESSIFEKMDDAIKDQLIAVKGVTRRNITIAEDGNALICHIQNPGFSIEENDIIKLQDIMLPLIKANDIVVLSGSIPPGMSTRNVQRLVEMITDRKAIILADVDPAFLRSLDCRQFHLVKPNVQEMQVLAGKDIDCIGDFVTAAVGVIRSKVIVVSMGEMGAIWIDTEKGEYVHAKLETNHSIQSDGIGCGDAMMGAFALGYSEGKTAPEILRMGICAGYANLFCEEPGIVDVDKYRKMANAVKVSDPIRVGDN